MSAAADGSSRTGAAERRTLVTEPRTFLAPLEVGFSSAPFALPVGQYRLVFREIGDEEPRDDVHQHIGWIRPTEGAWLDIVIVPR